MPADNHLDDRRKHEREGGATDRADQGYEETQFWYRLRQNKCDKAHDGTENNLRQHWPFKWTEFVNDAGPYYGDRDVKLQGVGKQYAQRDGGLDALR